jgi:homoserine kinase
MNFDLKVPATTSNLGAGFDCFGMALSLALEVEVRPSPDLVVTAEGADVPLDRTNLVVRTLLENVPRSAPEPRVAIHLRNHIPLSRGMGSSASARVAGLAIAEVFEHGIAGVNRRRIAARASELEHHPDNATPAVFGGFCVSAGDRYERVEMNDREYLLLVPNFEIETEKARAALPRQVALSDAVFNLQRAALAVVRIARARELGAAAPFEDRLHQRHRLALDARLGRVFAALEKDAAFEALFLSGAGSTVFAIPRELAWAEERARAALLAEGLGEKVLRVRADNAGLVITPR